MNFLPRWKKQKPAYESLSDKLLRALKPTRCKRLLLLEDDKDWSDLIREFSANYDVEFVNSVTSGYAKQLMDRNGPFDAIIIDIGVVNGDGIAFYRWLKQYHPEAQVVFLTGASIDDVSRKINMVGSAPIYLKDAFITPAFIDDIFQRLGARLKPSLHL